MDIAMVGLGRMGGNMARRLLRGGHRVVVWNRTYAKAEELGAEGAEPVRELADVVAALPQPRVIWLMLPVRRRPRRTPSTSWCRCSPRATSSSTAATRPSSTTSSAAPPWPSSGIRYLDAGTSGGVWGLEVGYCLMVGGERSAFEHIEPILKTLAPPGHGYEYCGGHGSGHFVKMVHNGIEYGMMQAYAEGFELLEATEWDLDLASIADLWNQGSVVRSWLLELAADAFKKDPGLEQITGYVEDTGEGRWTVEQAIAAQRADAGDHGGAVHALPLAPGRHVQRQGAGRPAQRVRRPRRAGEEVTASDDADPPAGASASATRRPTASARRTGLHVGGAADVSARTPSPFGGERDPDPCSLVIFGVTGDLTHRKLIPALYDLGCHGVLPFGTTLVGYGRQALTDDEFRDLMRKAIDDHYGAEVVDGSLCERILQTPRYVQGQFDDAGGLPAPRRRPRRARRGAAAAATACSTSPRRPASST